MSNPTETSPTLRNGNEAYGLTVKPSRVRSWRWKRMSLVVFIGGVVCTALAVVGVLHIDGTVNADRFTTAQDVVGVAATLLGFAGLGASFYWGVVFWRRPGVRIAPIGVEIFNWRPITVPWSFVTGTGRVRTRRWVRARWLPAIRLADERLLALRFAGDVPSDGRVRRRPRGGLKAMSLIDSAIRDHHLHDDSILNTAGASSSAGEGQPRGRRSCALVPFDGAQEIPRQRLPSEIWGTAATVTFLSTGQLARFQSGSGHRFYVAQFAVGVSTVVATAAVVTLVLWVRFTRRLVIAPQAIAWKSRFSRCWRTFYIAELVATKTRVASKPFRRRSRNRSSSPPRVPMSIMLQRPNGSGVRFSEGELRAGAAPLLLEMLRQHPGVAPETLDALEHHGDASSDST